jgi:hypothetical protein
MTERTWPNTPWYVPLLVAEQNQRQSQGTANSLLLLHRQLEIENRKLTSWRTALCLAPTMRSMLEEPAVLFGVQHPWIYGTSDTRRLDVGVGAVPPTFGGLGNVRTAVVPEKPVDFGRKQLLYPTTGQRYEDLVRQHFAAGAENPAKVSLATTEKQQQLGVVSTAEQGFTPTQKEIDSCTSKRFRGRRDRWYARLNELVSFKKENGHCNVPKSYHKYPGLGKVRTRSYHLLESLLSTRTSTPTTVVAFGVADRRESLRYCF